jgi:competence protein ComEA
VGTAAAGPPDGALITAAMGQLDGLLGTAAGVPPDDVSGTAADHPPDGASRIAAKSIKVGWRVRRWLPPGTTEVRLDPGRRAAAVLALVLVLGAAVAGFGVWRSRPVAEPVPAALPAASEGAPAPTTTAAELVVSVAGLVTRPGLVRLPAGARVADAVAAAGGPVPGTDLTGLNLARRLADGEHVVVGPAPVAAGPTGQGASPPGSGARVDLNTAALAELDALPGVGPVTAQRILDWRTEHGRFTTVDQLREIEGIGDARFARLRDLVTV